MSLPLIIDCDPGVDDAVMLMMALASDALDVRAITTVAGNVPLALTSRNARMIDSQAAVPPKKRMWQRALTKENIAREVRIALSKCRSP